MARVCICSKCQQCSTLICRTLALTAISFFRLVSNTDRPPAFLIYHVTSYKSLILTSSLSWSNHNFFCNSTETFTPAILPILLCYTSISTNLLFTCVLEYKNGCSACMGSCFSLCFLLYRVWPCGFALKLSVNPGLFPTLL